VLAVLFAAVGVKTERMVGNFKPVTFGHFYLQGFDVFVVKFFDAAAV
jgi:hypothetical protein